MVDVQQTLEKSFSALNETIRIRGRDVSKGAVLRDVLLFGKPVQWDKEIQDTLCRSILFKLPDSEIPFNEPLVRKCFENIYNQNYGSILQYPVEQGTIRSTVDAHSFRWTNQKPWRHFIFLKRSVGRIHFCSNSPLGSKTIGESTNNITRPVCTLEGSKNLMFWNFSLMKKKGTHFDYYCLKAEKIVLEPDAWKRALENYDTSCVMLQLDKRLRWDGLVS